MEKQNIYELPLADAMIGIMVLPHARSAEVIDIFDFVAKKLLAYKKIKAYPGSWAEWGNADETPIRIHLWT